MKYRPHLYLYETNTVTIVTGAGAFLIDKKTGKLIRFIPEKDPRYANIEKNLALIESGASVVEATVGMAEHEAMQTQAVKMLLKAEDAINEVVAKK